MVWILHNLSLEKEDVAKLSKEDVEIIINVFSHLIEGYAANEYFEESLLEMAKALNMIA